MSINFAFRHIFQTGFTASTNPITVSTNNFFRSRHHRVRVFMLTQYLDAVGKIPMENNSKTKEQKKAAFLIGSETRKRKFKRVVEE